MKRRQKIPRVVILTLAMLAVSVPLKLKKKKRWYPSRTTTLTEEKRLVEQPGVVIWLN